MSDFLKIHDWGPHVTVTHDALHFTVQGPLL